MTEDKDRIGGSLDLEPSIQQKPSEKRHRYPCTVCIKVNTAACDSCKCDACQVAEEKCPQCKNLPKDLCHYLILYGVPQKGENWEGADYFTCTQCGGIWKVKWEVLPKYEACRHCRTTFYCMPFFTKTYKGTLIGAHRPGLNWEKEDIFKCPSCGRFFFIKHDLLPNYHTCACGRRYYCQTSEAPKRLQNLKQSIPFFR